MESKFVTFKTLPSLSKSRKKHLRAFGTKWRKNTHYNNVRMTPGSKIGPLSYLHSGLPKTIAFWILPYCIGDRGLTENTEWDTLQFVKVGSPTKRRTKMHDTSTECWVLWAVDEIGFKLIAALLCSRSITEVPIWLPLKQKTPIWELFGQNEDQTTHFFR